jgi:hypothetical protein
MPNLWKSYTVYLTLHCLFEVLSVRNGKGADVRDAKFVEILRSARTRIRSAQDSFQGIFVRRKIVFGHKCGPCQFSIFAVIGTGSITNPLKLIPLPEREERQRGIEGV